MSNYFLIQHPDDELSSKWRNPEKYPYKNKMSRKRYEAEKYFLQVELLKLQKWIKKTGERLIIIFEGRDAAGKGGTIKRFMEHLNPRGARTVALDKPTEVELGQWYFQRYISHLPTAGEIVLFDRSWYNRAGVEKVMGFCTEEQYHKFMRQVPILEKMLVEDGIHIIKFWFSVTQKEQKKRFYSRENDPLKQWKLSPMDKASMDKWEEYSHAKEEMFNQTDIDESPWIVIKSDCKKRARLNAIRYVLSQFDYEDKNSDKIGKPDSLILGRSKNFLNKNYEEDMDKKKYEAMFFDLDGTLINSLADLVAAGNYTRKHYGLEELPEDLMGSFLGEGVNLYVNRFLTGSREGRAEPEKVAEAAKFYKDYYGKHLVIKTTLYPQVKETLAKLAELNIKMAVITNKPEQFSKEILETLGVAKYFSAIYGADSFAERKPSGLPLIKTMEELGVSAENTLMVGDSQTDMEAAINAGVSRFLLTYGYGEPSLISQKPDYQTNNFADLLKIIS